MNVLSLFDGIGAGLQALKSINIQPKRYVAYEVDAACIQVAKNNHPEIEHKGSVIDADFTQYEGFDLVIGGSPCQGFSNAGYKLAFEDHRSRLIFEYVRALKEVKPVDFLYENVVCDWWVQQEISKMLWTQPIKINSALVSAQVRKRLYWTLSNIPQPVDKGINVNDILETNYLSFAPFAVNPTPSRQRMWGNGDNAQCPNLHKRTKANCLTIKQDRQPNAGLIPFWGFCRYLTTVECERLQTFPDDYTQGFSRAKRYEMLGNSWTVEVIAHIFSNMPVCIKAKQC